MSSNETNTSNGNGSAVNFVANQQDLSDPAELLRARQNLAAARASSAVTSIIEYRSAGQCLVVAAAADDASLEQALDCAAQLSDLKVTLLCPLGASNETVAAKQATESGLKVFYRHLHSIQGYLGNFDVLVSADESVASAEHLGVQALTEHGLFDLILDLRAARDTDAAVADSATQKQVTDAALSPFGFFPVNEAADMQAALETLPQLVGEFEKPKYFQYDASICAHSRSKIEGCTNCLDVCATGAISVAEDSVSVDPFLCQGCGHCSTVCPSGAMTYAYPSAAEAISKTRELMDSRSNRPAVLLLHCIDESLEEELDDESAEADPAAHVLAGFEQSLPGDVLAVAVEEPAAYGMDYWATMIAAGIKQIVVLLEPVGAKASVDDGVAGLRGGAGDAALAEQAQLLGQMLSGLGLPADMVRVVESRHSVNFDNSLVAETALPQWPAASFATHNDKRQTLRMAMDHLDSHMQRQQDVVPLPQSSPFGSLTIKTDACTLCMACVTTCPAGALLDGHSEPQLKFVEANCVQCGLCRSACPEDALDLEPQYRYDSLAAREHKILNEEEPFHCVRCHKAFATQKMIETMTGKLAGHWMFENDSAVRRLKMCEDCRVKDMFEESNEGIQVHKTEGDKPV